MGPDGRRHPSFVHAAIAACRKRGSRIKIADSTGVALSGRTLLISALVLRRLLRRALDPNESHVAVLLPPSAGAALTHFALALDGRVVVGLNYTLTPEMLNPCLAQAGIRHVISSRAFLERVPLSLDAEFILLEDLRPQATKFDKLCCALLGSAAPAGLLLRLIGRTPPSNDERFMVVFTSGTTGEPKGAVLTYGNAQASIDAIAEVIRLEPEDVLAGVLPFFHAFGSIVTLWAALSLDIGVAYHPNPLDAEGVGRLCRERKVTIIVATPTFLSGWRRRGRSADFQAVDTIITGGERLSPRVADEVERDFGTRPVQGYGATETTSLIAANIPANRVIAGSGSVCREGTVGRHLPGVRLKVVDPDTNAEVAPGRPGMLWVSGANVMSGYLDRPDATRAVMHDGWYETGDMVTINDDGSIEIVGRLSRFAKIGGEMIPLERVEQALTAAAGDDENEPLLAVVSVFDAERGERLVVVHRPLPKPAFDLVHDAVLAGLPPLFAPSSSNFVEIDRLPLTATGKTDIARVTAIAQAARE